MSEEVAQVAEVTSEEAVRIADYEIELAGKADSLEHMRMHLETALIWLRGVDREEVREYYATRHATPPPTPPPAAAAVRAESETDHG